METLLYEAEGRVARITLNRPERGNGITPRMPVELAECVERANLDPEVHAIALAGNGTRLLRRLRPRRLGRGRDERAGARASAPPPGSPLDPAAIAANHAPE